MTYNQQGMKLYSMKAIKITHQLKETNYDLFGNIEIGFNRQFSVIPTSFYSLNYNAGQRTDGYHLLDDEIHKQDGFFDLMIPELNENEKLGEVYFDEENQVFTYQKIELSVEEIKARIPQVVSQRQLRTQLVLTGFNLSDIDTAIKSLPEPDRSIALIAWDYAITFERESPLLVSLALMLGLTEYDLENIFINASQL